MCDEEANVSRLETPIKLEDMINKVSEFTIRSSDMLEHEEDTDLFKAFKYNEIEPFCLPENLVAPSDDDDNIIDDIGKSFPIFRKRMKNLTEDGKIMKLIEKPGNGPVVPEKDDGFLLVYVHYAAYVEYEEYPIDVTRLRQKKPERFRLGVGQMIEGLETAIRSMRKNEKSKFLIHPDLAYRGGCPPRIPPQATMLFDVELFDFCQDENKFSGKPPEQKTVQDYISEAKKCRERGNKRKQIENNVNGAISMYRRGTSILLTKSYANRDEEKQMHEELLKLYTNLAMCYGEKNDWKKVCTTFNDAMHDCPEVAKNQAKLFYILGKALRFLGDYSNAKSRLRQGLKLKPGDQSILTEMEVLESAIKKYSNYEKNSCRRMFGFTNVTDKKEDKELEDLLKTVTEDFKETFTTILDDFLGNDELQEERYEYIPTIAEKEYCRLECKARSITLKQIGNKIILHKNLL